MLRVIYIYMERYLFDEALWEELDMEVKAGS